MCQQEGDFFFNNLKGGMKGVEVSSLRLPLPLTEADPDPPLTSVHHVLSRRLSRVTGKL